MSAPRELEVLAVYQDARLASSRIRVQQLAPWLEAAGLRVHLCPYPSGRSRRQAWSDLRARAEAVDVVVIQKKLPSIVDGLRWRRLGRPIVFDFDDALPLRQRPKRGEWHSATRQRRFERALRIASGVVAGNAYLASLCGELRAPLLIAPSPVPFPVPNRRDRPAAKSPRVGWVGGRGNLGSLREIAGALRRAAERTPFVLVVVSDGTLELEGVQVENSAWSLADQEERIAELDVGLMPMEDSPWSRGKCAYKALQYMAAGVPVVASPVGMNAELIEHGRNGLLAEGEEAWCESLLRLLDDAALRRTIGDAGQLDVGREYTYPVQAARWAEHLRRVAAEGGGSTAQKA